MSGILVLGWFSNSCTSGLESPSGVYRDSAKPSAAVAEPGEAAPSRSTTRPQAATPSSEAFAKPVRERPGLATGWGTTRKSPYREISFERATSKPRGIDMIYYNDREGLDAMGARQRRASTMQEAAGGLVEWGVKGDHGFLPTWQRSDWTRGGYQSRRYVEGRHDREYRIVIKNRCKSALQVVLSVDGLDVLDGKPASVTKRGYVIPAGETLEVPGFRTDYDRVAAFRFSKVSHSYAQLSGSGTRNVGVIGMAVYTQKGVDPWTWMPDEIGRRQSASPFAQAP